MERGLVDQHGKKNISKKRKLSAQERKFRKKFQKKSKQDNHSENQTEEFFDLWGEDPSLEKVKKKPYLKSITRETKKASDPIVPKGLAAVEIPEAGASYNPSEEDHHQLLKKAVSEQIYKRKEHDDVLSKLERPKGVKVT